MEMNDLDRVRAKMREMLRPEVIETVLDRPAPIHNGLTRRQMVEQGRADEVIAAIDKAMLWEAP